MVCGALDERSRILSSARACAHEKVVKSAKLLKTRKTRVFEQVLNKPETSNRAQVRFFVTGAGSRVRSALPANRNLPSVLDRALAGHTDLHQVLGLIHLPRAALTTRLLSFLRESMKVVGVSGPLRRDEHASTCSMRARAREGAKNEEVALSTGRLRTDTGRRSKLVVDDRDRPVPGHRTVVVEGEGDQVAGVLDGDEGSGHLAQRD